MRSDEQLMQDVSGGDRDAFAKLIKRHETTAMNVAFRILGDYSRAEEVAQEAFLKIFDAADDYEPSAQFKTYLCRVVARLCYDRSEKNEPSYSDDLDRVSEANHRDNNHSPLEQLVDRERQEKIQQALNGLPIRQRLAISLQHFEGMSYEEIAEVMDTSEKSVERLLHRARGTLRDELESYIQE
ncbi:MAG: RNA polymerase sigma factor [bacterium]